ncbi:FtsK/SpoIIIE domain-containing protein [Bacillus sp. AFS040349]|uniref:FtsK/SpoIIIE domain-containing protein n=1 Tax=Bacillus sp. AFS040349 TaxID=2033502 RepID=UPI000BFC8E4D|nr:FtsK/SpoIIIE domain-containing protein [Bacillus sp. AFS040349]PGT89236.1 cell division protein FtsK [Bacillus sp. AFS040349]
MIFEITTSMLAGGLVGFSYYKKTGGGSNDHEKIVRISRNCGLVNKEGKEIRIFRKTRKKNYTEYVYQMPQGLSVNQFQSKIDNFNDGLNIKKTVPDIYFSDFEEIDWKGDVVKQVKKILNKKKKLKKEVEIKFDGMLKFKVFDEELTSDFPFDEELLKKVKGWKIPVGVNRSNELIMHDFEMYPHLALGGATRYGKSNFINSMITTLIINNPDHVKFHLIDLKGGIELCDYENIKQTVSIAYEPEEALNTLKTAYEEMRIMQEKIKKLGKKKIQDTNIKTRHFVIIDEVGELNPEEAVDKKDIRENGVVVHKSEKTIKEECQQYMSKIARLGAGFGFRQILATQYPTGDVIPRQCKQNSDAKLSFKVRNATASNVVLDENGAEDLPRIKGRALYITDQRHIVQTPYIKEEEIRKNIQPHINIRPRKERVESSAEDSKETTERRKYTPIIEETELS